MLTAAVDIGDDNKLKQRSNSNTSSLWSDGPLNDMNLTVLDADQVGMQACWYGNAYGDTDYVHTDRPSTGSTAASSEVGEFDQTTLPTWIWLTMFRDAFVVRFRQHHVSAIWLAIWRREVGLPGRMEESQRPRWCRLL